MIGSRFKKLAIVAGAGALATASTLALNPFSASATDATTTTTVTAPAATTGHAVKFTAKVSPSRTPSPVTKATGTVTFTIVGSDNSSVACTGENTVTIAAGRAICKVAPGPLTPSAPGPSAGAHRILARSLGSRKVLVQ